MKIKKNYFVHISTLKQALNYGLELEKVHRAIQFRQEAWLKAYIDKITKLRQNAKNEFEKNFFKLMNNSVFGKTMKNVRSHRDVKLIVTEQRRKKLTSEPNYDSFKQFTNDLMEIEMRKTEVLMNKPIAVGQAILDISKTEFIALRAKTYAFVEINEDDELEEHKKAKDTKKCVIKKHLNFDLYKQTLFNNETIRCTQQRFKSEHPKISTQNIHKTALNNKDD